MLGCRPSPWTVGPDENQVLVIAFDLQRQCKGSREDVEPFIGDQDFGVIEPTRQSGASGCCCERRSTPSNEHRETELGRRGIQEFCALNDKQLIGRKS